MTPTCTITVWIEIEEHVILGTRSTPGNYPMPFGMGFEEFLWDCPKMSSLRYNTIDSPEIGKKRYLIRNYGSTYSYWHAAVHLSD